MHEEYQPGHKELRNQNRNGEYRTRNQQCGKSDDWRATRLLGVGRGQSCDEHHGTDVEKRYRDTKQCRLPKGQGPCAERKKDSSISICGAGVRTRSRQNAPIAEWIERDAIKGLRVTLKQSVEPPVEHDGRNYRRYRDRGHATKDNCLTSDESRCRGSHGGDRVLDACSQARPPQIRAMSQSARIACRILTFEPGTSVHVVNGSS